MSVFFTDTVEDYGELNMYPLIIPSSMRANQSLCFNVNITDDNILEDDEDFAVALNNTDDSAMTNSPAIITIIDNDGERMLMYIQFYLLYLDSDVIYRTLGNFHC